MTITVQPEPEFSPPRVRVDVAVPAGRTMQSVAVYRETAAGRELLRQQPEPGFDSRSVFDYEMPYETPLTYSWEAEYVDPADAEPTFAEPWANLAAWGGDVGIAAVSSGRVTLTAHSGGQYIMHMPATDIAWDRLAVGGLHEGPAGLPLVSLYMGIYVLWLTRTASGKLRIDVDGSGPSFAVSTAISASSPFEVIRTGTGFLVRGVGGTHTVPRVLGDISGIYVHGSANGPVRVGGITAQTNPVVSVMEESTASVTMFSDRAWLIHPAAPAKSMPLDRDRLDTATLSQLGAISTSPNTTLHHTIGGGLPIPVTAGNRSSDSLSMLFYTRDFEDELSVRALVNDGVPLLIRMPPSWGVGFRDGFYSVGDMQIERPVQYAPYRAIKWNITEVGSPAVTLQNAGWSYASVAAEFATYTAVFNAYATYADLMIDNRKPGY